MGCFSMSLLSISAAARAVKKSRGTIYNYLKSGRLSCTKDNDGNTKIDTSELLRVFGELSSNITLEQNKKVSKLDTDIHPKKQKNLGKTSNDTIIDMLQKQLQASQEREKKLLAIIEQEQQTRWDLEQRFLSLPEGQPEKPGWLARLFGKK